MKKYVKATTLDYKKPLSEFTQEELEALPEWFLCRTRIPGGFYGYTFKNVSRKDAIKNPNECFTIDSYWGYAHGRDIYLATYEDVAEYEKKKIDAIKEQTKKWKRYIVQ